jgi:hypothetical protein
MRFLWRILEAFQGTVPEAPYKVGRLVFHVRGPVDDVQSWFYDPRPRMELKSWINGRPSKSKFVRLWVCPWGIPGKPCPAPTKILFDWTLMKRQFTPEKIPGYKLHVSAQVVMDRFGVSRATAFQYLKLGSTIEEIQSKLNGEAEEEKSEAQTAGR